jgi:geranylgeranyl reductase family protein
LDQVLDVVVAGAGPAGASCARRAAELGLRVVLLERERFPRPKHCAAGLPMKALAQLGPAAAKLVHREFRTVELVLGARTTLVWRSGAPLIVTTTRLELDALLAEEAAAAGARLECGAAVDSVSVEGTAVRVGAGARTLHARYLVAADGARGGLRGLCSARRVRLSSAAFVRAFPPSGQSDELERDRITFDLRGCRRGYGWVFPKRDHLNAGVYTQRAMTGDLVTDLRAFLTERGLGGWRVEGPFAFPIPAGPGGAEAAVPRVLFAGDAAGLADPVTGEGVRHALASGRAAAESVAEALGSTASAEAVYARRIDAEIRPEVDVFSGIGGVFYTLGAGVTDRVLATPPARAALLRFGPWGRPGAGAGRLSVETTAGSRSQ